MWYSIIEIISAQIFGGFLFIWCTIKTQQSINPDAAVIQTNVALTGGGRETVCYRAVLISRREVLGVR